MTRRIQLTLNVRLIVNVVSRTVMAGKSVRSKPKRRQIEIRQFLPVKLPIKGTQIDLDHN